MRSQQICYIAEEGKSVKDLQILIAYKLEMLHFKSKNASVIIFADDITGNQEEQKNIKAKILKTKENSKLNFETKRNFL